jgi:hypothetical protein
MILNDFLKSTLSGFAVKYSITYHKAINLYIEY